MRRTIPMGGIRMWPRPCAALTAGVLSFASPKESSQRLLLAQLKGDPGVGAGQVRFPVLLARPGGLPKLACGSNKASRLPPACLRCSAPSTGARKASQCCRHWQNPEADGQPENLAKIEIASGVIAVSLWPSAALNSAGRAGGFGSRCLSRGEFMRTARPGEQRRVPGGAGRQSGCALSLLTFFRQGERKSCRASGAKTSISEKPPHDPNP